MEANIDMDFDHQFIPTHKYYAKYSYQQDFGYFPGWTSVEGIIVDGENRDGKVHVKFPQEDTLCRIMDCVNSELVVVIERFRTDCDSFFDFLTLIFPDFQRTFYSIDIFYTVHTVNLNGMFLQIYKLSKTEPVCPLRNFSFYHDKLFEDVQ